MGGGLFGIGFSEGTAGEESWGIKRLKEVAIVGPRAQLLEDFWEKYN